MGLLPPGSSYPGAAIPLCADESRGFVHGVENVILHFQECSHLCPRLKRWRVAGPHEFLNPKGEPRPLYSLPGGGRGSTGSMLRISPPIPGRCASWATATAAEPGVAVRIRSLRNHLFDP